jgi:uncharacterized protein (DUF2249 family)
VYKDTNNIVFYVGSGNKQRPYYKHERNKEVLRKLAEEHSVEIIATDLTKEESINTENSYLKEYFNTGIKDWKLLNRRKSANNVKFLTYEFCSTHWYYCENSPSFICWNETRIGHNGRKVVKAGDSAGSVNSSGYYNTNINKESFGVHRIAWVLINKQDLSTDLVINHIDSCRTNNSAENLEAVTPRVNNIKRSHNNTEMLNIYWHKRDKLWDVRWCDNSINKSARFKPKEYGSVNDALIAAKLFRDKIRHDLYSF